MTTLLKTAAVTVVVVMLQVELLARLRVDGVMPELALACAIAAATQAGAQRGAIIGFGAGLLYDAHLVTPFGLAALAGTLLGYLIGTLREGMADPGRVGWLLTLAEVAGGICLFIVCGLLIGGDEFFVDGFTRTVLVSTLYTGPFLPLLHRLYRWAMSDPLVASTRQPVRLRATS